MNQRVQRVSGVVPSANNLGVRYPNWHAKHPRNAVVVPPSVAPTVTLKK